ncbi:MAG: nucleotidyltransferase domain-containing protein [Acidobacteriia bacterium]|nr:nucleotidyltransferase domain-containing protein [Terriglobia bacterium]
MQTVDRQPVKALTGDPLDDAVVQAVYEPSVAGVLLHGSRAAGAADELSDFDVICVLAPGHYELRREFLPFRSTYIDACYSPVAPLFRRLHSTFPNNNNFLLNALTGGRILLDTTGELSRLMASAQEKRAAGPPGVPESEAIITRKQIRAALSSAERILQRGQDAAEFGALAQVRLAEIFSKAIYTYQVERRRWTSSLPSVIRWAGLNCPELYLRARAYLIAMSDKERISALHNLLDMIDGSLLK